MECSFGCPCRGRGGECTKWLEDEHSALTKRVAQLEGALNYYAKCGVMSGMGDFPYTSFEDDMGQIAREALHQAQVTPAEAVPVASNSGVNGGRERADPPGYEALEALTYDKNPFLNLDPGQDYKVPTSESRALRDEDGSAVNPNCLEGATGAIPGNGLQPSADARAATVASSTAQVDWGGFATYPRCGLHGRNEMPGCDACQRAETIIPGSQSSNIEAPAQEHSDLCAHGFVKGTVTCLEEEGSQTACRKCGTNGEHYCPSDRWDTPENARKEGIEVYSAEEATQKPKGIDAFEEDLEEARRAVEQESAQATQRNCACGAWGWDEHTASCKASNGEKV